MRRTTSKNSISVKNPRATNILRGLIGDQSSKASIKKALKKIDIIADQVSLKQAISVIRSSELFKSNALTRYFLSETPSSLVELVDFNHRDIEHIINDNEAKLLDCLNCYHQIIANISNKEFQLAIDNCLKLIDEQGVSLGLIRLLLFINNRLEYLTDPKEIEVSVDDIIKKIGLYNLPEIEQGVKQIISDRADYFSISSNIRKSKLPRNIKHILECFIFHIPKNDAHYLEILNAHFSFSLLDAVLYAHAMNKLGYPSKRFDIPDKINSILADISSKNIDLSLYNSHLDDALDLSFYRESYLLMEIDECLKYKTVHGAYFNLPDVRKHNRRSTEIKWVNDYFSSVQNFSDLRRQHVNRCSINLDKYNASSCCFIENSSGFTYLIDLYDGVVTQMHELTFIQLMSETRDLAFTIDIEHLQTIEKATFNPDVKLICLCLLVSDGKDKDDWTEFRLRKAFQSLVKDRHNGSILEMFQSYYSLSPAVTEYLVDICDETFISRLFNLSESTNQALETRAEILRWYGSETNDQALIDRAKNIRIDIQINKHKQHINDARIYADPARVSLWINDNYINKLAIILDDIYKLEQPNFNVDWSKLNQSISPEYQLAHIVTHCYKEFISNKLYGVSSYLGRRIRHGTVKGNAVDVVKNLIEEPNFKALQTDTLFMNTWKDWLQSYGEVIEELVEKKFHIKDSANPYGLLSPDIDTKTKQAIAGQLLQQLYESFKRIDKVIEAPSLIIDYCWRLIFEDLSITKQHLHKVKDRVAIFKLKDQSKLLYQGLAQEFAKELNTKVGEKFKLIISWFEKPSYASPSADLSLLFKVALCDVQDKSHSFNPKVIGEQSDITISGGQYFVIFDVLEILIKNIERHGKRDGFIKFESYVDSCNGKELFINLISQFKSEVPYELARKAIEDKYVSTEISDANIKEFGSGIKKLKSMLEDKSLNSLNFTYPEEGGERLLQATFSMKLGF